MLKLKLYTFAMLCKEPTCWKNTRILGKIEGRRKKGQEWMKWLDGINDSMSLSKLGEIVKDRKAWSTAGMGSQKVRLDLGAEQQQQR